MSNNEEVGHYISALQSGSIHKINNKNIFISFDPLGGKGQVAASIFNNYINPKNTKIETSRIMDKIQYATNRDCEIHSVSAVFSLLRYSIFNNYDLFDDECLKKSTEEKPIKERQIPKKIFDLHNESHWNYLNSDKVFTFDEKIEGINITREFNQQKKVDFFSPKVTFDDMILFNLSILEKAIRGYGTINDKSGVEEILKAYDINISDYQIKDRNTILSHIGNCISIKSKGNDIESMPDVKEIVEEFKKICKKGIDFDWMKFLNDISDSFIKMYNDKNIDFNLFYPLGDYPRFKLDFSLLEFACKSKEFSYKIAPVLTYLSANKQELVSSLFSPEERGSFLDLAKSLNSQHFNPEQQILELTMGDLTPIRRSNFESENTIRQQEELLRLWTEHNERNESNDSIFGTTRSPQLLSDNIVRNIINHESPNSGINILPANQSTETIIGQIFQNELIYTENEQPEERRNDLINSVHLPEEVEVTHESGEGYLLGTNYYIPNNYNNTIILTTGTSPNQSDSGSHYVALNIRRVGNEIFFNIADSFANQHNILQPNPEILDTISGIIRQINFTRNDGNLEPFDFHITNLFDIQRQQNQIGYNTNTCGIWAALNAVNMQNISNEEFINLFRNARMEIYETNCERSRLGLKNLKSSSKQLSQKLQKYRAKYGIINEKIKLIEREIKKRPNMKRPDLYTEDDQISLKKKIADNKNNPEVKRELETQLKIMNSKLSEDKERIKALELKISGCSRDIDISKFQINKQEYEFNYWQQKIKTQQEEMKKNKTFLVSW